MRGWFVFCLALLWMTPPLSFSAFSAEQIKDRFFVSGDGVLRLTNSKTKESQRIQYRLPDGTYPDSSHRKINRLFGVAENSEDSISLRLISVLDYLEDHEGLTLSILSGFRSANYNEGLRAKGKMAAKTSLHIEGMAVDLSLDKKKAEKVFNLVKDMGCCGIGYYHGNSIHIDTGPTRYWDETTSKVNTDISTNNKRIMVSTDQDIYKPGERVVLKLARITNYPIGIRRQITAVKEGEKLASLFLKDQDLKSQESKGTNPECLLIHNPRERTYFLTIPENLQSPDKISLQVSFCQKASTEMPDQIESNRIRIED